MIDQTSKQHITLVAIALAILTWIIVMVVGIQYGFLGVIQGEEAPYVEPFRYFWYSVDLITLIYLIKIKKMDYDIGPLMLVFIGPITLTTFGYLYLIKKFQKSHYTP